MNIFQFAQIPTTWGSLNQHYLNRINDTLMGAFATHPRALIARIDLHIPYNGLNSNNPLERDVPICYANTDVDLMKRFMASLKAQINIDQANKAKQGGIVYPCPLNYVWVRERCKSINEHYHVALIVNQNAYYPLGKFHHEGTLACMVKKAWASALDVTVEESQGLAHIPENPVYTLNSNHPPAKYQKYAEKLAFRLAYLAKEKTKILDDGRRNFGCSNPWKGLI